MLSEVYPCVYWQATSGTWEANGANYECDSEQRKHEVIYGRTKKTS